MAWTRTLALGLLFGSLGVGAPACVVSVDDDPDDNFGGDGGTAGVSGSGGSGNGGRSGSGGSTSAGTGGSVGGTGGSDTFPAPTCDPDDGDTDECSQCLKQNCCTPWLGCDDETCATELVDVSECVQAIEFATTEDLGMCISMSSAADDGLVQANTQAVIDCAITPVGDASVETPCSVECFGSEIYIE